MSTALSELDLHGYTSDEALRVFVDVYNRHARGGARKSLRVIHGYGAGGVGGKIRQQLRALLESSSPYLEWRPGEDVENNPGVTIVYVRKALPPIENQLAAEILAFCTITRTLPKITGKFRKYRPAEIKEALRALTRSGRMQVVQKSGVQSYVADRRIGPT